MSGTIDKIKKFFGDTFGNSTTGPKWGSIATVAAGAIGGFFLGDVLGAGIGLVAGTLLGPVVNGLIEGFTNGSGTSYRDRAPDRIVPQVQEKALETVTIKIGGKEFKLDMPKVDELKKP